MRVFRILGVIALAFLCVGLPWVIFAWVSLKKEFGVSEINEGTVWPEEGA